MTDRIITLTMNPAVDKSSSVEHVSAEIKLRCDRPVFEAGGGGVNVSRALHRLGGDSLCLYVSGRDRGRMLGKILDDEGVRREALEVEGEIRENLIVFERASGLQYRFGMPGPELSEAEWRACLHRLGEVTGEGDWVVASGSLPPGAPEDFYARVAKLGADQGARVIVDCSGKALELAVEAGLYLIKPNLRELEMLSGEEMREHSDVEKMARRLLHEGKCEAVVVSLGGQGAAVIGESVDLRVTAPTVPVKSKVGAGDSMVAGMVMKLAAGEPLETAARFGVASGAAAVMTGGSELCRREDAERIFQSIKERSGHD